MSNLKQTEIGPMTEDYVLEKRLVTAHLGVILKERKRLKNLKGRAEILRYA